VYIAYSVELKCDITEQTKSEVRRCHHVYFYCPYGQQPGAEQLVLSRFQVFSNTYVLDNKSDQAIDLFIEHPRRADCELTQSQAPADTTANFYRFNVELPAKTVLKFEVKERKLADQIYDLRNLTEPLVVGFYNDNYVADGAYNDLRKLVVINEERALLTAQRDALYNVQLSRVNDSNRIKSLLDSLYQPTETLDRQEKRVQQDEKNEIQLLENEKRQKQENLTNKEQQERQEKDRKTRTDTIAAKRKDLVSWTTRLGEAKKKLEKMYAAWQQDSAEAGANTAHANQRLTANAEAASERVAVLVKNPDIVVADNTKPIPVKAK